MKILSLPMMFSLVSSTVFGQNPVDVAESTLKVAAFSEEVFYFAFAEGDQVIFNFREANNRKLKKLEVIELPSSLKFMDYKTKKIENKVLVIPRNAIYKFCLTNSSLTGRVCKFRIQRIPANDSTRNFNTSVYWKTVYDTTYVPMKERYLIKSDTIATNVLSQVAKISSQNALNGNPNTTVVDFILPERTISWSYYLGVGKEGRKAYDKASNDFLTSAAATVSTFEGFGPMAALALTGLNAFGTIQGNDNVKYWFITDWDNVQLFRSGNTFLQYKQGDVVNDAAQMRSPLAGRIYIGLKNDNLVQPIEVLVKVTAIQVEQTWGTRTVKIASVTARQEVCLSK